MAAEPILRKVRLPHFFDMTLQSAYAQAAFAFFEGGSPAALEGIEARLLACTDENERRALCEETITFHTPTGPVPHIVDVAENNQLIGACRKDRGDFQSGYEPYIHAAIEQFAPADAVIFDVGANWGPIALQTALRPEFRGVIHAFEPQRNAFKNLHDIVDALHLQDRIRPHHLALSDREGVAHLTDPKWRGAVAISPEGTAGPACPMMPLDAMDLPDPHLIKIDVEGHEGQVLAGAQRLLQRAKPLVIFEDWIHAPKAHFEQLSSYGYRFYYLCWFDPFNNAATGHRPFASSIQILALQAFDLAQRDRLPPGINLLAAPTDLR